VYWLQLGLPSLRRSSTVVTSHVSAAKPGIFWHSRLQSLTDTNWFSWLYVTVLVAMVWFHPPVFSHFWSVCPFGVACTACWGSGLSCDVSRWRSIWTHIVTVFKRIVFTRNKYSHMNRNASGLLRGKPQCRTLKWCDRYCKSAGRWGTGTPLARLGTTLTWKA
jgi:hypothetical protein